MTDAIVVDLETPPMSRLVRGQSQFDEEGFTEGQPLPLTGVFFGLVATMNLVSAVGMLIAP